MADPKNQIFDSQADAFTHFNEALQAAKVMCDEMNSNDDTVNATYTYSTDAANNRYVLTRPDQMDGTQTIFFGWR